jgi:hypothetical protein
MKKGIAVVSMLLSLQSTSFAQSRTPAASPTAGIARIAATLDIGQLQRSTDRTFVRSRQALSRGSRQAQPSARNRHPVMIGAAIGAGAGLLINVSACRTGESVCTASGNLLMAGIGAGVGALVGVLVSRR